MLLPSRKAAEKLGLHPNTLRAYADAGKIDYIRTPSGQRRYDVASFIGGASQSATVCYCRVSSPKQKDDLARQVAHMQALYPQAEIVKDIGSGLNFKRKGLRALLERSVNGDKLTVVAAHRDRLARFGYELIKWFIERTGGQLLVLDDTTLSPESELTKDLLNILRVFSCRLHGLRNYKKQVNQDLSDNGAEKTVHVVD